MTCLRKRRLRIPESLLAAAVALLLGAAAVSQTQPASVPAKMPAAMEQAEQRAARMTFLELLIKGGWFMVPIAAASLLGLALILERSLALRRSRIIPRKFMRQLKAHAANRKMALNYCRTHGSPLARVMEEGLHKLPQGESAVEKAMEDAGQLEVHRLRRNLRMLYGVAAVAPMMGLLGTVWGMIEAFRVTAAAKGLGKPELLATGIYQALVTTLAGLMVAIPVLMIYYYFTGKIEHMVTELNDASRDFVRHFVEEAPSRQVETRETELSDADQR